MLCCVGSEARSHVETNFMIQVSKKKTFVIQLAQLFNIVIQLAYSQTGNQLCDSDSITVNKLCDSLCDSFSVTVNNLWTTLCDPMPPVISCRFAVHLSCTGLHYRLPTLGTMELGGVALSKFVSFLKRNSGVKSGKKSYIGYCSTL